MGKASFVDGALDRIRVSSIGDGGNPSLSAGTLATGRWGDPDSGGTFDGGGRRRNDGGGLLDRGGDDRLGGTRDDSRGWLPGDSFGLGDVLADRRRLDSTTGGRADQDWNLGVDGGGVDKVGNGGGGNHVGL